MSACKAALNVAGQHYPCAEPAGHSGWPHANPDARAIWSSDAEVEAYEAANGEASRG